MGLCFSTQAADSEIDANHIPSEYIKIYEPYLDAKRREIKDSPQLKAFMDLAKSNPGLPAEIIGCRARTATEYMLKAWAYDKLDDIPNSIAMELQAVKLGSRDCYTYAVIAKDYNTLGDDNQTIKYANLGLKKKPNDYELLLLKAEAYNMLEESLSRKEGTTHYSKSLKIISVAMKFYKDGGNKEASLLHLRGCIYKDQGKFAKAEEDLTAAIALSDDDSIIYAVRGEVRCELGKEKEAAADFKEAAKLLAEDSIGYSDGQIGYLKTTLAAKAELMEGMDAVEEVKVEALSAKDDDNEKYVSFVELSRQRAENLRIESEALKARTVQTMKTKDVRTEALNELSEEAKFLAKKKKLAQELDYMTSAIQHNEAATDYRWGFKYTLTSAYESGSNVISNQFPLKASNWVSKLSNLAIFLPMGGDAVRGMVKSAADLYSEKKLKEKLVKLQRTSTTDEFSQYVNIWSTRLTYEQRDSISLVKSEKLTTLNVCHNKFKSFFTGDSAHVLFQTPAEFMGHLDATKLLAAIYNQEIGERPRDNFMERGYEWIKSELLQTEASGLLEGSMRTAEAAILGYESAIHSDMVY